MGRVDSRAGSFAVAVVLAVVCALPAGAAAQTTDETRLAGMLGPAPGVAPNDATEHGAISGDGRYIAFETRATTLCGIEVCGDADGAVADIFRRDMVTGDAVWVSRGSANKDALRPSISGDGCRISYWTEAQVLPVPDTNSTGDIYVADLCDPNPDPVDMSLASAHAGPVVAVPPSAVGNAGDVSSISGDGSTVAFSTRNPVTETGTDISGPAGVEQAYVRDLGSLETRMLSVNAAGTSGGNDHSDIGSKTSISADGNRVVFSSGATDLTGDSDPHSNLAGIGCPFDYDGVLTFGTGSCDAFLRDVGTGSTTLVPRPPHLEPSYFFGGAGAISADGNVVAIAAGYAPPNPDKHVYSYRPATGGWTLVDCESGPCFVGQTGFSGLADPADDQAVTPSLSRDGRFVAFVSFASNLVYPPYKPGGNPYASPNMFVRDTLNQTTFLYSRASGVVGNPASVPAAGYDAQISSNGNAAIFTSAASLDPLDANPSVDIYRRVIKDASTGEPDNPASRGATFDVRPVIIDQPITATLPSGQVLPVEHMDEFPIGTIVNASGNSRVELTSANDEFRTNSAQFYGGIFRVGQPAPGAGDDVTTLDLTARKLTCKKKKKKGKKRKKGKGRLAAASARSTALWGTGRGRFRTRGGRGAATIRGTTWLTENTCRGTRFTLLDGGPLEIDDFGKRKLADALLTIPNSRYFAKAKSKKKKKKKGRKKG